MPAKRDNKEVDNFRKNFKTLYKMLEVWFYDETGICGAMPPRDNEDLQDRIQEEIRQFLANPKEVMSIYKIGY